MLPLVVKSRATDLQILRVRKTLEGLLRDRGGMVILSMDISHYKAPRGVQRRGRAHPRGDTRVLTERANGLDVDCQRGARLLLTPLQSLGAVRSELLERSNSADFLPNASRTTGHATVLFSR